MNLRQDRCDQKGPIFNGQSTHECLPVPVFSYRFELLRKQDINMGSELSVPASMMKLDLNTGSQGQGLLLIA